MNGQRCVFVLLVIVVTCCAVISPAKSQQVTQHLTKEWVKKTAAPLIENRVVDGLSVGYIEGDQWGIVHLGTANAAGEKPNNLTVYEIGSISKVFTGLLLADAVVRGEIDLDAAAEVANSAEIKLPSLDGTPIKWVDLSTHRSGLPRLPENLPLTNLTDPYSKYDSKQAAAFLNQYELTRQPGQSQEYSNIGGAVLGYLIAENAGQSYEQLLLERIGKPLRMADCTVSPRDEQAKRLAVPHDKFGSATPRWTFADLPAAGGINASLQDMMRFAKAQLNPPAGKIGEAIELAWKQHGDANESGPAMGLGWVIAGDGQTRWHNGQTGGSRSALFINRELKCAVVVLCNTSVASGIDELAMQMIMKAAGQDVGPESAEDPAEELVDLPIDEKLRGRLEGRYKLAANFIFDVKDKDGHLMVGITNQPTQEVFPDSATRWSYRGVDATLEFKLPKNGSAKRLVLHQNGAKQTARRIAAPAAKETVDLPIDEKLRGRLVGRYKLAPNFIFDVNDKDGHLMVGITNQPTQEVFPDSATQWSYRGMDAMLEFKLPKNGSAKSLVLHQNGAEQTARRMK